jgi:hypothetical protein
LAEATVNTLYADSVIGDIRRRKANISLAATGDTFTIPGASKIFGVTCNPPSTTNVFASISTNVATFTYAGGGAMAAVDVEVDFL